MRGRAEDQTDEHCADRQPNQAEADEAEDLKLQGRLGDELGERGIVVRFAPLHEQHERSGKDKETRRIQPPAPRHDREDRGSDEQPGKDENVHDPDDQIAGPRRTLLPFHVSGTNMNGRAAVTSSPAISTAMGSPAGAERWWCP